MVPSYDHIQRAPLLRQLLPNNFIQQRRELPSDYYNTSHTKRKPYFSVLEKRTQR
jgi:hypothetical protein